MVRPDLDEPAGAVVRVGARELAGCPPPARPARARGGRGGGGHPSTGAPRYSLEVVPLDPATGDRLPTPPDLVAVEESFDDPTEWMAAVEAKRAQIERR